MNSRRSGDFRIHARVIFQYVIVSSRSVRRAAPVYPVLPVRRGARIGAEMAVVGDGDAIYELERLVRKQRACNTKKSTKRTAYARLFSYVRTSSFQNTTMSLSTP